ncbi:hypothetical protein QN277_028491 [Acacia crassicarpa]|uniref:Uncharacterized protein n=1 Tax=Acacia crassicarpa TaxID=499986 RepID=A0AAE1J3F0_9FABA|nr:hypothetical protein QN277_028491 [Acacia crassicarpa]
MALSCLTCSQILQKTDSYREYSLENPRLKKMRCAPVGRMWSGHIAWEDQDQREGPLVKMKGEDSRAQSTGSSVLPGSTKPRLVRSPGMRRDWSLEDLSDKTEEGVMSL